MNNVEIRFAREDECKRLASLSQEFASENCCNNIIADGEDFFVGKKVAVAVYEKQIVGYCYGTAKQEENKRSYANVGDLFYDLEEMFVLKNYRDKKIGKVLFEFVTDYAKGLGCKTIRLNAISKDYKKLLNFYIDILGMDFISAYLVKKI